MWKIRTRFKDPDQERRFRLDALDDETRLLTVIQGIWVLMFAAFARNDWILLSGRPLVLVLSGRALVVAAGLWLIWLFHRSREPRLRDASLLGVILLEVAFGTLMSSTRVTTMGPLVGVNVVGILTCWVLLPLPSALQAVSALGVTAGAVATYFLHRRAPSEVELVRVVLELLLANVIGLAVSVLTHRERRGRYAAVLAAQEAGRSLADAQRELAESRLKELQSQLIRVQRAGDLGSLSVTLAHELGQPLTAIRNNAYAGTSYLDRDPPDLDGARSALGDVTAESERTAQIILRMRDYLGRGKVIRERVSPSELGREAVAIVEHAARNRGIDVRVEIGPDAPDVEGDRVQLLQVAVIALVNAMDAVAAMEAQRVELWARRGEGCLEMGVDDAGPGFPPDALETVFTPFFTTKPDGMGVGLPIARTIVEAHGGTIAAGVAPAGGARVSWTLPTRGIPT